MDFRGRHFIVLLEGRDNQSIELTMSCVYSRLSWAGSRLSDKEDLCLARSQSGERDLIIEIVKLNIT